MNTVNNNKQRDIITALATPYGKSAVAIIRISGSGCIETVNRFLSRGAEIGKMRVAVFKAEKITERLMVTCSKAPKSYTGEDAVELFPHGNMTICEEIIKALIGAGVRMAERGEFTKRAFLNGKVDLMQCEALADIIDAQTTEGIVYGNKRYDGGFKELGVVENLLKTALSSVEAVLHYSDELEENEIDGALYNDVVRAVDEAAEKLNAEMEKFGGGRIINDGFKVALIGAPNVGKSTILNALTESEKAIVTPIAGTTRDIIEGEYVYNGRKFVIIDTAGMKDFTDDEVERIGIERAKARAEQADAVLYVTENGDKTEFPINSDKIKNFAVAVNKCDDIIEGKAFISGKGEGKKEKSIKISAKLGKNITALKQMLYDMCPKEFGAICNHRQYDCVLRCLSCLETAKKLSENLQNLELTAALLYDAYSAILELYGDGDPDEKVISTVFERFCVGK